MVFQSPNLTPLPIDANGRTIEDTYRNIQSGGGVVTTKGTRVQLSSTSKEGKIIDIFNNNSVSGAVLFIGGTLVSSTVGIPLYPNNTYRLPITDLSQVWVDADTSGATFVFNYQW